MNLQDWFFKTKLDFSDPNKQIWPNRPVHLVTSVLTYINSKIIPFYLKHIARRCSGSVGSLKLFLFLLRFYPYLPIRFETTPPTSWNLYKCGHDKASTPGSNHEISTAFTFRHIRTSSSCLDVYVIFFTARITFFSQKMQCIHCIYTSHSKFKPRKFWISWCFLQMVCNGLKSEHLKPTLRHCHLVSLKSLQKLKR